MSSVIESQTAAGTPEPITFAGPRLHDILRATCNRYYAFPFMAVKVHASEWNGKELDDNPFEPMDAIQDKPLLDHILAAKPIIDGRGCDYAWFGFKDDYNNITWAGPGDYIVGTQHPTSGRIKVQVVPGEFYEAIFQYHEQPNKKG